MNPFLFANFYGRRKMDEATPPEGGKAGGSADPKPDDKGGEPGAQSNQNSQTPPDDGKGKKGEAFKMEDLPPAAQSYIKELRTENANRRKETETLGGRLGKIESGLKSMFGDGSDELTPEQKLESLQNDSYSLAQSNAVLSLAYENDIPKDKLDFFEFELNKAVNALSDDQELPEEALAQIVQSVKALGKGAAGTAPDNTGGKGAPDPNAQKGDITVEQFANMGMMDKNKLYTEKPDVYKALFAQAREKKLIK